MEHPTLRSDTINALRFGADASFAMLAPHPAERRAEVWQAIKDALGQYTAADGSVRTEDETLCVVGQR